LVIEAQEQSREATLKSRKLLSQASPDSFLGRKTQEAFPADHPLKRPDIQKLLNSELKPPE
jgi:hypothetical protein